MKMFVPCSIQESIHDEADEKVRLLQEYQKEKISFKSLTKQCYIFILLHFNFHSTLGFYNILITDFYTHPINYQDGYKNN